MADEPWDRYQILRVPVERIPQIELMPVLALRIPMFGFRGSVTRCARRVGPDGSERAELNCTTASRSGAHTRGRVIARAAAHARVADTGREDVRSVVELR